MPSTSSRDAARAAFDKLNTSEKSAFIFEATFNTIGQALEETGRRMADIFESVNVDDMFSGDRESPAEPEPKKAAPRKKPSARKTSSSRSKSSPSKTAGKATPKTDDDEA